MARIAQLVIFASALTLLSFPIFAECQQPAAKLVLKTLTGKAYFPGLKSLYFNAFPGDHSLTWLLLKWYGPRSGMLIAIACDGSPVGGLEIGFPEQIETIQISGVTTPAVLVEYIVATGAGGSLHKKAGIFKVLDGQVSELWSHDIYTRSVDLFCAPLMEENYDISVSADGKKIEATGVRTFTQRQVNRFKCTVVSISNENLAKDVACWNGVDSFATCE